jgi:hypothetical protein
MMLGETSDKMERFHSVIPLTPQLGLKQDDNEEDSDNKMRI